MSRLLTWLGIERGEERVTIYMFVTLLLLVASHTTTKAVRDAIFLSHFSLTQLAYLMIGMAVVAGIAISAFSRLTDRLAHHRLLLGVYLFVAGSLVGMGLLLRHPQPWHAWLLYVWTGTVGLVVLAEFWTLANAIFHAEQARRLFAVIAAGAILGGVVGGATSAWLAPRIGTPTLLYLVAAKLVVAAVVANLAWRNRPDHDAVEVAPRTSSRMRALVGETGYGFSLLKNDQYVRLIATLMLCTVVGLSLAEYQYKSIVQQHYGAQRDQMTAFFGTLAAVLSGLSFLLQIFVTSKLLRRYGVGACLRILPLGAGMGSVALLSTLFLPIAPIVPAAIAVLLADGLRFSVDKSTLELLYLPIDNPIRERAKRFVDTVVDRSAGAIAAILWLGLTWAFQVDRPERIAWPSLLTLAIAGIWVWSTRAARSAYIDAYRRLLSAVPEVEPRVAPPKVKAHVLLQLEALGRLANHGSPNRRTKLLRAIGAVQQHSPIMGFDYEIIEPHLVREIGGATLMQTALRSLQVDESTPQTRLLRALNEQLARAFERVARLLALVYPPHDILAVHRALKGKSPRVRAGALELLNSLVEGSVKAELNALFAAKALARETVPPIPEQQALCMLLRCEDPWLRACAAWTHTVVAAGT